MRIADARIPLAIGQVVSHGLACRHTGICGWVYARCGLDAVCGCSPRGAGEGWAQIGGR
jgi:hypothetical protein